MYDLLDLDLLDHSVTWSRMNFIDPARANLKSVSQ